MNWYENALTTKIFALPTCDARWIALGEVGWGEEPNKESTFIEISKEMGGYFLSISYLVKCSVPFSRGMHHLGGDGLKEHFLKKYHLPLQSLKPGSNKEKTWKKVSNNII